MSQAQVIIMFKTPQHVPGITAPRVDRPFSGRTKEAINTGFSDPFGRNKPSFVSHLHSARRGCIVMNGGGT